MYVCTFYICVYIVYTANRTNLNIYAYRIYNIHVCKYIHHVYIYIYIFENGC